MALAKSKQFDSSEYGVPVVSNPQSRSDILLPLGAPDRGLSVFIVREALDTYILYIPPRRDESSIIFFFENDARSRTGPFNRSNYYPVETDQ
jgi:hypothetical protein